MQIWKNVIAIQMMLLILDLNPKYLTWLFFLKQLKTYGKYLPGAEIKVTAKNGAIVV